MLLVNFTSCQADYKIDITAGVEVLCLAFSFLLQGEREGLRTLWHPGNKVRSDERQGAIPQAGFPPEVQRELKL